MTHERIVTGQPITPCAKAFYVSVIDASGFDYRLTLGPFPTEARARERIPDVRQHVFDVMNDPNAPWYAYGTAGVTGDPPYPRGVLNADLSYTPPEELPCMTTSKTDFSSPTPAAEAPCAPPEEATPATARVRRVVRRTSSRRATSRSAINATGAPNAKSAGATDVPATNTVARVAGGTARELLDALTEAGIQPNSVAELAAFPHDALLENEEFATDPEVGIEYVARDSSGAITVNLAEYCTGGGANVEQLMTLLEQTPAAAVALVHGDGARETIGEVRTDWEGCVELHSARRVMT